MTDHVYKTLELTGSSGEGIDKAVEGAIAKASETLRDLRWFQITDIRGEIDDRSVSFWQVTLKLGFTLEDNPVA